MQHHALSFSRDGRQLDVVVIGDALPDLVISLPQIPLPGQGIAAAPPRMLLGGSAGNVAVALARLGVRVGFVGRVGADDDGRAVRADLMARGVDTGGLVEDPDHATGSVIALVDACGERTMIGCVLGAAYHHLTPADLQWPPLASTAIVQVSGHLMLEEPGRSTALRAIDDALARGAVVHYDPNLRTTSSGIPSEQSAAHWEAMTRAQVVTATEEEFVQLGAVQAGMSADLPALMDSRATADRLLLAAPVDRPKLVVLKHGAGGATALSSHSPATRVAAYSVPVLDTIGAGDVFNAALIAAVLRGDPLADSLEFANAAAALSTTVAGGRGAPGIEEIAALQSQRKRSPGATETRRDKSP